MPDLSHLINQYLLNIEDVKSTSFDNLKRELVRTHTIYPTTKSILSPIKDEIQNRENLIKQKENEIELLRKSKTRLSREYVRLLSNLLENYDIIYHLLSVKAWVHHGRRIWNFEILDLKQRVEIHAESFKFVEETTESGTFLYSVEIPMSFEFHINNDSPYISLSLGSTKIYSIFLYLEKMLSSCTFHPKRGNR
jgi:hypothetical protein